MIKQAPRPFQIAVMVAFVLSCFGVLLYLWIAFGGVVPLKPEGYRVHVQFPEATQLAIQSDVRISGVPVGKVIESDLAPGNRTDATIELRSRYAPIPKDSRAMLRQKSLLGETYVDLTPGDSAGGMVKDGGALARSAVAPTVELDEIFRTFDADTQQAFRTWMQSQAGSVEGRGADINAFFGQLPEFVDSADDLLAELDAQSDALSQSVNSTGEVFDALSERSGQLQRLITQSDRLFRITAERNRDFAAIWKELPRFERESRPTLRRLTRFAHNADPVVKQLWPVADEMAPTFAQFKRLSPEFEGLFTGLGPLITASQRGVPALERLMKRFPSLLASFEPFLRNFNPALSYLDQNRRDITSFFGNTTAASNARDNPLVLSPKAKAPVHYLRTAQTLSPESLTYFPSPLGLSRNNTYMAPNGLDRLASGLASFDTRSCSNGNPAPPTAADPPALVPLVENFAYRTKNRSRNVAAPPCFAQGLFPGYGTQYPQLRAEP